MSVTNGALDVRTNSDAIRLLYIIYTYTKNSNKDKIIWIKDLHLLALIYHLIKNNYFVQYDFNPILVSYKGIKMFARLSQEAIHDLHRLLEFEYILKLKFSNKYYDNVGAYTLTKKGRAYIESMIEDYSEVVGVKNIKNTLYYKNKLLDIKIRDELINNERRILKAYLVGLDYCKEIDFFTLEKVGYKSKPWLPNSLINYIECMCKINVNRR